MHLKSKKLFVLLGAIGLLIVRAFVPELEALGTEQIVALAGAYLLGQGIADFGKGAEQVKSLPVPTAKK